MQLILSVVNWLILAANNVIAFGTAHPVYTGLIFGVIFMIYYKKKKTASENFLNAQNGYVLIDGKFWKGKTRFLTLLAREAKKKGMIVLSNFYNAYTHVRWNSVDDLIRLLSDMWLLWEAQNYNEDEIRTMYAWEGRERVKQKLDAIKAVKRRYKNIPYNGFYTRFLLSGDEMQNIFFNREAMGNFSGSKKSLLKLLHQIRHFNSLGTFALTDAREIDLKFRRISSFYLAFSDMLGGLILKYHIYNFDLDKEQNFDSENAKKLTKVPVVKFNGYVANKIVEKVQNLIHKRIKFKFTVPLLKWTIQVPFSELWFFSKFNADPDCDIYESGYLFEYLNWFYKDNGDSKFLQSN